MQNNKESNKVCSCQHMKSSFDVNGVGGVSSAGSGSGSTCCVGSVGSGVSSIGRPSWYTYPCHPPLPWDLSLGATKVVCKQISDVHACPSGSAQSI
ncbi:hypothetical protein ACOMHN_025899 [Nucella lapillus]